MRFFLKRRRSYLSCKKSRQPLNKKQKAGIVVASFLLVIIGILFYLNYIVNPIIMQMSEAKIRMLATKSVGGAIYEIVNQENIYGDLISIIYDNEGNVKLIQVDAIAVNQLNRRLTRLAQSNLEEMGNQGLDIPVGSFSGLPIFVGRGPKVNVKILPIGSISSSFKSEFIDAGINHTLHKIYINLGANVSVVLPTANQFVQTSTQVLVCENIIVGEVPITYLKSNSLDEMMNLIPT